MRPPFTSLMFISMLVGAEYVALQHVVRHEEARRASYRQEKLGGFEERVEQSFYEQEQERVRSSASTEADRSQDDAEKAWQNENKQCFRQGEHCIAKDGRKCVDRPLPGDKSKSESCRVSDEYMLRDDNVAKYMDILAQVAEKKAAKYARECGKRWAFGKGKVCKRRVQQIHRALEFFGKVRAAADAAPTGKVAAALAHAAEAQARFARVSVSLACAQKGADCAEHVRDLIAQVQSSALAREHPDVAAKRQVATLLALISDDASEYARAVAAIQAKTVCAPLTQQESDEQGKAASEPEATTEEVREELARAVEEADSAVAPRDSLLETGFMGVSKTEIAVGFVAALAVIAGSFLFFEAIVVGVIIGLAAVLLVCTGYAAGSLSLQKWGKCVVYGLALPFVFLGKGVRKGVRWIARKIRGKKATPADTPKLEAASDASADAAIAPDAAT